METIAYLTPYIIRPYTYKSYRTLVENLVAQNKTTGLEQTEDKIAFTKLNWQRMKRVEKQFKLLPELEEELKNLKAEWNWLVLSEAWCGDGAQLVPALAAIAEASPTVTFTVVLRDENPELMDSCLTKGARAIPKLVCIDAATQKRQFTWGPRPSAIKQKLENWKIENPGAAYEEMNLQLHTWYAKDRGEALQQDLLQLIKEAKQRDQETTEVKIKDLAVSAGSASV